MEYLWNDAPILILFDTWLIFLKFLCQNEIKIIFLKGLIFSNKFTRTLFLKIPLISKNKKFLSSYISNSSSKVGIFKISEVFFFNSLKLIDFIFIFLLNILLKFESWKHIITPSLVYLISVSNDKLSLNDFLKLLIVFSFEDWVINPLWEIWVYFEISLISSL